MQWRLSLTAWEAGLMAYRNIWSFASLISTITAALGYQACNDSLIENNHFDSNGVGMLDHHVYVNDAVLNNVALTTTQIVIRGNVMTNNSPYADSASAQPTPEVVGATAIVVHGLKDGVIIENNHLSESKVPTNGSCWGISADSGGYTGIYAREGFRDVAIRGNTLINYSVSIGIDLCNTCSVENNYITEFAGHSAGIVAPAKFFDAAIPGNTTNNDLTIRNNSIYFRNPNRNTVGIRLSRDGSNHTVVSNLIYLGRGTTTTSTCFYTADLPSSAFQAFDNNLCFFAGAAGQWDGTRTLDVKRGLGLDLHSSLADPRIVAPVARGLRLRSVCHPPHSVADTRHSVKFGKGGFFGCAPDIGAAQHDASRVVPSSPTGMSIK